MSGGGTQKSLRKALGAIKDTTTVSLAKVNSDYKELDIAIVKATNHYERPAKEKHIRAIFAAVSATRPRADVAYCIHALARRLSRIHNWAVALKTLIIIHRALREVDPTFHEELVNYGRSRTHILNMYHFKDDSSPNAWDYSAWVRTYALFLGERLECFHVLKHDIELDRPRTKDLESSELLEQLPALQQLLFRVLSCQPQGAAVYNFVIQLALSMVASESVKIYQAITDVCKSLDVGRGERFIKIEQSPASFLQAMEEYVREAPQASTVRKDQVDKSKEVLAIEYKKTAEPSKTTAAAPVPVQANGATGWELALVTAPSSNDSAAAASKLAGGLEKLTLDSLYDDAIRRSNQNVSYNPWEPPGPINGAAMQQLAQDPFFASNMVAAPHSVQEAAMANQQQAFMLQQPQQMMMIGPQQRQPSNPFGNPYGASAHPYSPARGIRDMQIVRKNAQGTGNCVPYVVNVQ
ncbi:putative clathrin assembly protein [Hibiscus syriacus]|uniref:Clathrin assembly protein n=1 Tax=Hibiscus syriacus TaxID=106335 RepID=A0A6A2X299_HIBSY|nr:putative clathrin assembly protein [Hibiscus syriacus]